MKPWTWRFRRVVAASPRVVLENYLDEEHVAELHQDGVGSYRVLERSRDAAYVEIGTRLLGMTILHAEWVQVVPPCGLVVRTRLPLGLIEARAQTRIIAAPGGSEIETDYTVTPVWFLRPFKGFLLARMRRWKEKVFQEDVALLVRRQKLLDAGFKDGIPLRLSVPLPAAVVAAEPRN